MNSKLSKLFATVLIAAMALGAVSIIMAPRAESSTPPAAPSYYVDPSSQTFYTSNTPVGTLFNVTVWAVALNGTDSWSFQLGFNASMLQEVNAGFVSTLSGGLFFGHSTTPLGPVIDNVGITAGSPGVGSVEMSETTLAADYIPATTGPVVIVTFNITAAPAIGQNLTCLIDPAFGLPPQGETLFILQSPTTDFPTGEIDNPNTAPCTYSYVYAPTTPPAISNVTQVPENSINDNESVLVSANITDNSNTGLYNETLWWSTDNVTYTNYTAMSLTSGLYEGNITGYPIGTTVYYEVQAFDNAGNMAMQYGNSYTVIPEFPNVALLAIMMVVVLASVVLITRKKRGR